MCIMVPYMQTLTIKEMDFMADRRPPQRPAIVRGAAHRAERRAALRFPAFGISPLRRAALGRAALRLPALGGGRSRRSSRRSAAASASAAAFTYSSAYVALIIVAVVLLIWRPWASGPDPVDPAVAASTPAAMAPAADATVAPGRAGRAGGQTTPQPQDTTRAERSAGQRGHRDRRPDRRPDGAGDRPVGQHQPLPGMAEHTAAGR